MTAASDNPYQSPEMPLETTAFPADSAPVAWKSVLRRWERLRPVYNLLVGITGLLVLLLAPAWFWPGVLVPVLLYGLMANVMYLLGPTTELYLNWLVESKAGRLVPRWLVWLVRAGYFTALLFVAGTLFSVGLTLLIGLIEVATAAFPAPP